MQPQHIPIKFDQPLYTSPDGQVAVIVKKTTAKRYPQHDYPLVCLLVKAKPRTRIQTSTNGEFMDICLTNRELTAFFQAVRSANPDHRKTLDGTAQDKDPARKKYWDDFNQRRHWGKGKQNR